MRRASITTTMNNYGSAHEAALGKASDAIGKVSAGFKAS